MMRILQDPNDCVADDDDDNTNGAELPKALPPPPSFSGDNSRWQLPQPPKAQESTTTPPEPPPMVPSHADVFMDTMAEQPISWREAVAWFSEQQRRQQSTTETRKRRWFPGRRLEEESLLRFVAAQKYDPCEPVHWRMLRSIHAALVEGPPSKQQPSKIGSHWEVIGFQGSDPRTDLNRSIGCLALVQLLALVEDDVTLARDLFRLANVQGSDWPLACTSLSLTADVLPAATSFHSLNARHRAKFAAFKRRLDAGEDRFHALNRVRGLKATTPKKKTKTTRRNDGSWLRLWYAAARKPVVDPVFLAIDGPPPPAAEAAKKKKKSLFSSSRGRNINDGNAALHGRRAHLYAAAVVGGGDDDSSSM
mmetsp:Transcript_30614/g.93567  ORF Transcript_30614/g.93567 Transcript_30614/m.93567 type:complete len:364 (+) Transcript_30614:55-1146(+)